MEKRNLYEFQFRTYNTSMDCRFLYTREIYKYDIYKNIIHYI